MARTSRRETIARIEHDNRFFVIRGGTLSVMRDEAVVAKLPLAPIADGVRRQLGAWRAVGNDHYRASVKGIGSAHLGVREGRVAFWIETKKKWFDTFTYFPETEFLGDDWRTFVSDGWDRLWDKDLDKEVGISSAYLDIMNVFGADGAGLTDPGDNPPTFVWNMPARVFCFEGPIWGRDDRWLGFSIPGALPVGVTRLSMKDRRFSLHFDALRPACRGGAMPVVYFVPGLAEPDDVLDAHREISDRLGLTVKKSGDHPAWWSQPVFKAYLEHWRLTKDETDPEKQKKILSTENLLDWTFRVKESLQRDQMLAIFEQGVYRFYGDYTPIDTLGGAKGFRKTVDGLRRRGVRVCYYIHPFMVNTKAAFYQKHPEAFCKPKDRSVMVQYACENYDDAPQYGLVDWTHPLGRKYILSQVELILSKKKGCLNCDWLRSNHWRSPDPRSFTFHDPDWGIGDMMSMKVQKLIYEKAKSVKPDCCVSKVSFADPYMQPYADVNLLCEEWNGSTDTWYRRGRIVSRTIRDMLYITDPYFLTITKSYEYYMSMLAWCICETPDVSHAVHPYLYFRKLRPKEYKRRLSGVKVQENAPLCVTDRIHVDPPEYEGEEPEIWRRRTSGPLTGFYAALALSKRTVVTYSETEARIGTTETRRISFPLPPGARVKAVEKVSHAGKITRCRSHVEDGYVCMKVEDCAGNALYYRVRYQLK